MEGTSINKSQVAKQKIRIKIPEAIQNRALFLARWPMYIIISIINVKMRMYVVIVALLCIDIVAYGGFLHYSLMEYWGIINFKKTL